MPRKLTVMRKPIIQPNAGFFTNWFPGSSMTGAPDVAEVLTTWSCVFWSIPNKYDPNPPVNNNTMQIPQNKNPISRVRRRSDDHNPTKSEENKKNPQHSGRRRKKPQVPNGRRE
jgi:hypothetical protein